MPVAHVEQGGQGVEPQRAVGALRDDDRCEEGHEEQHQEEGGQQASGPAGPEGTELDRQSLAPLPDEQRGDQEARQDEEGIDPHEPAVHVGDPTVEHHHGQDGAGSHAVERGEIGQTSVRNRALVVLHGADPSLVSSGGTALWVAGNRILAEPARALRAACAGYLGLPEPDPTVGPPPATPPSPTGPAPVCHIRAGARADRRGRARGAPDPPRAAAQPTACPHGGPRPGAGGLPDRPLRHLLQQVQRLLVRRHGRLRQRQPRRGVVRRLCRLGVEAGRGRGGVPAGARIPERQFSQLLCLGHRPRHLAPGRLRLHPPTRRRRRVRARHLCRHGRPRRHRHRGHGQRRRARRHQRRRRQDGLQRGRGRRQPGLRRRQAEGRPAVGLRVPSASGVRVQRPEARSPACTRPAGRSTSSPRIPPGPQARTRAPHPTPCTRRTAWRSRSAPGR